MGLYSYRLSAKVGQVTGAPVALQVACVALFATGMLTSCGTSRRKSERSVSPCDVSQAARQLDLVVGRMISEGRLVRGDGFVYAIDVALLALSAAIGNNRLRYEQLVAMAKNDFVVENPTKPTAPFVTWRRQLAPARSVPDASGTTEAFQMAQALLVGGGVFRRSTDTLLAARLLDGYALHADTVDGTWLVRNYYNLGTNAFATNSYLIDYAPDLLMYAATELRRSHLEEVATKSTALIRGAVRPNGLIDAVIQPELKTLFTFVVFSPNDVIKLEHSAMVAEQVVGSAREVSEGVLLFALSRLDDLHAAYEGRTGAPHGSDRANAGTFAAVARLAVRLKQPAAIEKLCPPLVTHSLTLARTYPEVEAHVAAQALLGLQFLLRWQARQDLPASLKAHPDLPLKWLR